MTLLETTWQNFFFQKYEFSRWYISWKNYDLVTIPTPAISADWLDEKYDYDGFVFLSNMQQNLEYLALTCHSTGNFSEAKFGGNDRQVAIPHPSLQKTYLQTLKNMNQNFQIFKLQLKQLIMDLLHLKKPSIFIEIGTTEKQWTDVSLVLFCSNLLTL